MSLHYRKIFILKEYNPISDKSPDYMKCIVCHKWGITTSDTSLWRDRITELLWFSLNCITRSTEQSSFFPSPLPFSWRNTHMHIWTIKTLNDDHSAQFIKRVLIRNIQVRNLHFLAEGSIAHSFALSQGVLTLPYRSVGQKALPPSVFKFTCFWLPAIYILSKQNFTSGKSAQVQHHSSISQTFCQLF